jgi:hypothetical protein
MTTKRVPIARSHRSATELSAWSAYLSWGRDYFRALERLGLSDEQVAKLAPTVWKKHASKFMLNWRADGERDLPWAAQRWGLPHAN